ncbi:MAG: hypothetical protein Q9219_002124 [cf. Caloplaca sp. 3 TL-2023]
MSTPSTPPLPPTFTTLKSSILTSLSTPSPLYTDASPKGTLDAAIVPLIERLNGLEGVVTTSSCAGRVSVFVEGGRKRDKGRRKKEGEEEGEEGGRQGKGKGMGGRWAFVSHERVDKGVDEEDGGGEGFTGMFGMRSRRPGSGKSGSMEDARYVRFAFEPMILHIAAASLAHASPILSAAISAGFRESGVQSLKNLADPDAIPVVAVRSAGLAFESIIGVVRDGLHESDQAGERQDVNDEREFIEALVDEHYLEMLVEIANKRFDANTERMKRFEESLFKGKIKGLEEEWEDKETRQERKRREGLMKREALTLNSSSNPVDEDEADEDICMEDLEGIP